MSSPDRNSRGHSPIPAEAEEAVDENPVPDAVDDEAEDAGDERESLNPDARPDMSDKPDSGGPSNAVAIGGLVVIVVVIALIFVGLKLADGGDPVAVGSPSPPPALASITLAFPGDLAQLNTTQKTAMKAAVKNTTASYLQIPTSSIKEVLLRAGSIMAKVVFTAAASKTDTLSATHLTAEMQKIAHTPISITVPGIGTLASVGAGAGTASVVVNNASKANTTKAPTAAPTTAAPTTKAPTAASTKAPTHDTAAPTTASPTAASTTASPTAASTTAAPTAASSRSSGSSSGSGSGASSGASSGVSSGSGSGRRV